MIPWNYKNEKNIFIQREENGVPYLSFAALEETGLVVNGFSTRLGGASKGKYATMNFAWNKGDDPADVLENYTRMAKALGVDRDRMVASQQTHTTNVRLVTEEDAGKGVVRERDYTDVDGLITNGPDLTLATFYADCVPLYFADRRLHVIGLSHSGWRGTVNNMAQAAVDKLGSEFGSRPEDIIAFIGPSICASCYEVGEDVAEKFFNAYGAEADKVLKIKKETEAGKKYYLNLHAANRINMLNAGITEENISVTDICTCCNPELFFSHRASKGKRGGLCAYMMIAEV